jgi:hypothetical protein
MKNPRILLALSLLAPLGLAAQSPDDAAPALGAATAAPVRRTAEIEQLVAPIALYPDALVALILPAANSPADIVLAARQVRATGSDRSQIEHRSWDESVKSLTSYPEVLQWMDENLQWTKQIGEAFAEQPVDVMQAIQRLRAKARAAGMLVDTPQQIVLSESEVIRIVPAQASTIYVPYYQPEVVFVDRPVFVSRPLVGFGVGVAVGSWLAFDCDWRRHTIWVSSRHRPWSGHDWRRPLIVAPVVARPSIVHVHSVRPWTPPPRPGRPAFAVSPPAPRDPRPAPPRDFSPRPRSPGDSVATYRPAPPPAGRDSARPADPTPSSPPSGPRGHRGSIPDYSALPPAVTAPPLPTSPERSGAASAPTTAVRSHGYPGGAREAAPSRSRSSGVAASLQASPPVNAAPTATTPAFRHQAPPARGYTRSAPPAAAPAAPVDATPSPAAARSAEPASSAPGAAPATPPASRRGGPAGERGIGRPDPNAHER